MQIIIPMAGEGCRFVNAGYRDPKPLINLTGVDGSKRMLTHVLDSFRDPSDTFVFVCNNTHLMTTDMRSLILSLRANARVVSVYPHKKGPVFTIVPAFEHILDDAEVMIAYCDSAMTGFDREAFFAYVRQNDLDGCLLTHTGFHPHVLSTTKMAFVRNSGSRVEEVKEKASYTDDPLSEHASSGFYYFRRGAFVKQYFKRLIEENQNHNGEFYITLAYNPMIRDGLKVGYYDTQHVAILGTPEEVTNFEAWATILRGAQVRNEADLLRCYHYWKEYHNQ